MKVTPPACSSTPTSLPWCSQRSVTAKPSTSRYQPMLLSRSSTVKLGDTELRASPLGGVRARGAFFALVAARFAAGAAVFALVVFVLFVLFVAMRVPPDAGAPRRRILEGNTARVDPRRPRCPFAAARVAPRGRLRR